MSDLMDSPDVRTRPASARGATARGPTTHGIPLYRSTKTYDHNEGLSCCFRQWRASHSHCRLLHGYALAFHFIFVSETLDERNWCFDFGGLKPVRAWLHHMFDHTTLIAEDDPHLPSFQEMEDRGLIDLRVVAAVGCESVAAMTHEFVSQFVTEQSGERVRLESVEVREHAGNSAVYSLARV